MQTKKNPKVAKIEKSKIFIQSWEVYPFDILFAFNVSDEHLYKTLKNLGQELNDEDKELLKCAGNGRTAMLEGGQTVIRLKNHLDKHSLGHLVHEIFHATHFLFDRINIKLSMDSDEAFAYAMGFMTDKVIKKLK